MNANHGESGIYRIVNMVNEKVYIGQSINVRRRLVNHKNLLNKNKHDNIYLQRSYNKYGLENFRFELIEKCEENELYRRENHWMDFYESYNNKKGYNILTPNENGDSFTLPEELRRRQSIAMTVYSDEELISYLHEFYYMENRLPTMREDLASKGYPSAGTYYFRFGSLKKCIA